MEKDKVNLVFIFLGRKLPAYFIDNVKLTARNFPNKTFLFLEEGCEIEKHIAKTPRVTVSEFKKKDFSDFFSLDHEKNFREGFWIHTFERLLYLSQIHEYLGRRTPMLHIEGDMLLLPSFPMESIKSKSLRWFQHNEVDDVASLVYSPNLEETNWLHQELIKEAKLNPLATDMSALRKIRFKNPERIETFPNIFDIREKSDIFDGAAFGQWLTGMDLRNTYGFQILHENGDFKANSYKSLDLILREADIFISNNDELSVRKDGKTSIVHSLHIHSKDKDLFSSQYGRKLQEYVDWASSSKTHIFAFSRYILWECLKHNYKERSLYQYLRHFAKFLFKGQTFFDMRIWKLLIFFLRNSVK